MTVRHALVLGDPEELRAAGASEVAPSVAAWVETRLATAVGRQRPPAR